MDATSLLALNPNEGFHHNILVFGVSGSGVSSLVNTIVTGIQPQRVTTVVKNLSKTVTPTTKPSPGKRTTASFTKHVLGNYLPNLKVCLWESWGIMVNGGGGNNYESIELDLLMQGMLTDRLTMPKDTKVLNQIISQAKKADHLNAIHAAMFVVPQELLTGMAGQEIIIIRKVLKKLKDVGRPVFVVLTKIDQYAKESGLDDEAVKNELSRLASRLLEVDAENVHAITNYNSPAYHESPNRVFSIDNAILKLMSQVISEACSFQDRDPAFLAMKRSRNNLNPSSSQTDIRKASGVESQRKASVSMEKQVKNDTEPVMTYTSPRKNNGLAFDALFAQVPEGMKPSPSIANEPKNINENQDDHEIEQENMETKYEEQTEDNEVEQENITSPNFEQIVMDSDCDEQNFNEDSETDEKADEKNEEQILDKENETFVNELSVAGQVGNHDEVAQENDFVESNDETIALKSPLEKSLSHLPPLEPLNADVATIKDDIESNENITSPTLLNVHQPNVDVSTDITESTFQQTETFVTAQIGQRSFHQDVSGAVFEQDIVSASTVGATDRSEKQSQESIEEKEEEKTTVSHVERMEAFKNEMLNAVKMQSLNAEDDVDDYQSEKNITGKKELVNTQNDRVETTVTTLHDLPTPRDFISDVKQSKKTILEQHNVPINLPVASQQVEKNTRQKGGMLASLNVFSSTPKNKAEKTSPNVQVQSSSTLTSAPIIHENYLTRIEAIESTETKLKENYETLKSTLEQNVRDISDTVNLSKTQLHELRNELVVLTVTSNTIQKSQHDLQSSFHKTELSIQELKNKADDLEAKLCLIQHDTIPASLAADKELLESKTQELNNRIDKVVKTQREAEKLFDEHVASTTLRITDLDKQVQDLLKCRSETEEQLGALKKEVQSLKMQQATLEKATCKCVIS